MKLQKKSVLIRSPDLLKEHTNRKEVQEEQKRRTRQAGAGMNEEIEMEQKERWEVAVETKEESTEGDVDEYYSEDPSDIGIVTLL